MSHMYFDVRSVSRGRGGSAVGKAAYVFRERLRDERTGKLHDGRRRGGLEHAETFSPATMRERGTEWTRDRSTLWNAAETAEKRVDARVAREYVVALPHELSPQQRLALAREFAQGIADRYGAVADLAVHHAPPGGDPRNHHAHVLATTRELTATGLGRKTAIELNESARRERGLPRVAEELRILRRHWAELANEKLREARIDARLDPRSLAEQGINRRPQPHLSRAMIGLERRGQRCYAAERLREQHEAYRQWQLGRAVDGASVTHAHAPEAARSHPPEPAALEPERATPSTPASIDRSTTVDRAVRPLTLEERQQAAAERWLAYRQAHIEDRELAASPQRERTQEQGHDLGAEL
jgi:ATP-dependent exoDNAse (exonuclease V) alpha subunit